MSDTRTHGTTAAPLVPDNGFFQAVLDSLDEQFALIDHTGTIVYVNPSWQRFGEANGLDKHFRWPGSSYLEACRKAAAHGDSDAMAVAEGLSAVLNGLQNTFHYEYPCHSAEEKRWFILRAVPVRGYEGTYFAVSHQNITRRKLAEESAAHLALHDSLTGLANRRHFDDFLRQAWRRGHRSGKPLCLLMIDLDHFKAYNDAHGHLEGDRCLCLVGNLLRIHASRETDLAARFGGDEFALVLGDTDEAGGRVMAGRILQGMGELDLKVTRGMSVGASIGLGCRIPGVSTDCADTQRLIALADAALYRAKASGGCRFEEAETHHDR